LGHLGKTLPFVVERKVHEIELGYVIYDNTDIIIELLSRGLAKIRGEKINSDHIDDYKDAEVEAQMAERGIWS
jgi:endonuclease YncB( thermonuclease family)